MTVSMLMTVGASVALAEQSGITPIIQDRSLSVQAVANGIAGSDSQSSGASAPDYNPFNASRSTLAMADPGIALSTASQHSRIETFCIMGDGEVTAFAGGDPGSDSFGLAVSTLSVTFDLFETVPFRLTGDLFTQEDVPPLGPAGVLSLLGPTGYVVSINVTNSRPHATVDVEGELVAGRYTLLASVVSDAVYNEFNESNSGYASYDVNFCIVPEPTVLGLLIPAALLALLRKRV